MLFEFKPENPSYQGETIFQEDCLDNDRYCTFIERALICVEDLVPGTDLSRYTYQQRRLLGRERYFIDTYITINHDALTAEPQEIIEEDTPYLHFENNAIAKNGLPLIIIDDHQEYQGKMFPKIDPS
jgi:hypothetical protein